MLTKRHTRTQAPAVSAAVQAFLDGLKPGESLDLVLNPTIAIPLMSAGLRSWKSPHNVGSW